MAFVSKEISGLFTCELPWSISCTPRQLFQPLPTTVYTFHRTGERASSGAMTTFEYCYRLKSFPKILRVKKIILKTVKPHSLYKYPDFELCSPLQQTCAPWLGASAQLWRCCSPGLWWFLWSGEKLSSYGLVKVIYGEGTIKKSPLPQAWYWHEALPQAPDFGEDDIPKSHHHRFFWDFQKLASL